MPNILEQQAENRRGLNTLILLSSLLNTLNLEEYQNLLSWAFEVLHPFRDGIHLFFPHSKMMQGAEYWKLSLGTKYLARVYFDTVVCAFRQMPKGQHMFIMVTCLGLAIKFNENRQISERLTLPRLFEELKLEISTQKINQLELLVWEALSFRMRSTCPDDYLEIFMSQFPFYKDMLRNHLLRFIELGLLHSSACQFTAEEMFYGAVLVFLKVTGVVLNNRKRRILSEVTDCWNRANGAALLIKQNLNQAENDLEDS